MEGMKTIVFLPKNWNIMMECLKIYRDTTDTNDFIPIRYVIPSIATFSAHLQGLKLRSFLQGARQAYHAGHSTTAQIDTLQQYLIHWDYELYKLEFDYLPLLDAYKKIMGINECQ